MPDYKFNADEIFEMALEIERNGAAFYRAAANKVPEEDQKQTLRELADMEDDHYKTFEAMRAELSDDQRETQWADPEDQIAKYLRTYADLYVFDVREDPAAFIKDDTPMGAIYMKAIDRERDSILFYVGMKEMVPESLGATRIDDIIREEISHITTLNDELEKLGGA